MARVKHASTSSTSSLRPYSQGLLLPRPGFSLRRVKDTTKKRGLDRRVQRASTLSSEADEAFWSALAASNVDNMSAGPLDHTNYFCRFAKGREGRADDAAAYLQMFRVPKGFTSKFGAAAMSVLSQSTRGSRRGRLVSWWRYPVFLSVISTEFQSVSAQVACSPSSSLPCTFGGCTFSKDAGGMLSKQGTCSGTTGRLYLNSKGIESLSADVFVDVGTT